MLRWNFQGQEVVSEEIAVVHEEGHLDICACWKDHVLLQSLLNLAFKPSGQFHSLQIHSSASLPPEPRKISTMYAAGRARHCVGPVQIGDERG